MIQKTEEVKEEEEGDYRGIYDQIRSADEEEEEEADFFEDNGPIMPIAKKVPPPRDRALGLSTKRNSLSLYRKVNKLLSPHQQKEEEKHKTPKVKLSKVMEERYNTKYTYAYN